MTIEDTPTQSMKREPRAARGLRFGALVGAMGLLVAACAGGGSAALEPEEAASQLLELTDDIDWEDATVTDRATIELAQATELQATLPPIDEFLLSVDGPDGGNRVSVEIFASTEKSGEDTDGWLVDVAEDFNDEGVTLANGSVASIDVRRIPSGTGFQYIAAGRDLPDAFTPSSQLWVEMASRHQTMTEISDSLVSNVAGIVMKTETATELGINPDTLTVSDLIDAVIADELVMGYTDPFASSTGLNFLVSVLNEIAEGDEARMTSPDVASVFEQFQRRLPFVALTTLQVRESVERDNGTLDAFVMEWQTFVNTESLDSGFEFIPFGIPHDNPLYAVGDPGADKMEALELFAAFAEQSEAQRQAVSVGFDPPAHKASYEVPSGDTLIEAQKVWKDNKDGGRPVAAVFVVDVSGSMSGSRIQALHTAMLSSREFITPDNSIGVVEFSDRARLRLEIDEFGLEHQGRYVEVANRLEPAGGTAMYDGIVLALSMLADEQTANPETRPLIIVLTDGEVTEGKSFKDVEGVIAGLGVPIHTVGFEADLDELARLSALVEAANINADETDVQFKMAALFNAGL